MIEAQAAAVSELQARVERLERLISRNSGNSSFPPSADGQPGRRRRAPRPLPGGEGGGRRPGKQPGAPGAHLAWRQTPDERVAVRPGGRCGCGAALAGAADLGAVSSHQQADIPLVTARVTQYDLHAVRCPGCGRAAAAAPPPGLGAPGTVTYGPNLQAWCVYLMVAHAVPVHRCAELLAALSGAAPSPGLVHGLLARAAAAVAPANRLIRSLVILADAVSCDETPVRAGPGPSWRKRYLLVAATGRLTWAAFGDRDAAAFARSVLPDLAGTVVHDRYQVYDHQSLGKLTHQLCCAHLFATCKRRRDVSPRSLARAGLLRPGQLIHAANQARDQGLAAVPPELAAPSPAPSAAPSPPGSPSWPPCPAACARTTASPAATSCRTCATARTTSCASPPTCASRPPATRPNETCAPRKPGQDLRPPPLRDRHPPPLRHPRLHLHRRQAQHRRPHRPARRPPRHPLDAAHPRHRPQPRITLSAAHTHDLNAYARKRGYFLRCGS